MTHKYTCMECGLLVVCHGEDIIACVLKVCKSCFIKAMLLPTDLAKASVWVETRNRLFEKWKEEYIQTKLDAFFDIKY